MKLGGFGRIEDYDRIREAGYDYAELDMPQIEELDEASYQAFTAHVKETGFAVPTGARILPVTDPLFFVPGYDERELEGYLRRTCARSAGVGIKKILFGNGKARWLVDEDALSREQTFVSFMRMLCEIAGENGQEILIEPLGPKYSNYMNTVPQALETVAKVNMPNLCVMADLRHFIWSGEPLEDIAKYHQYIGHYHIDFPLSWPERRYPSPDDGYNYGAFLSQIKNLPGDVTLTVESDIPEDWNAAGKQFFAVLDKYM